MKSTFNLGEKEMSPSVNVFNGEMLGATARVSFNMMIDPSADSTAVIPKRYRK